LITEEFEYKLEAIDRINKTATISTYDFKNRTNVTLKFSEDTGNPNSVNEFWDMFAKNEARKL